MAPEGGCDAFNFIYLISNQAQSQQLIDINFPNENLIIVKE